MRILLMLSFLGLIHLEAEVEKLGIEIVSIFPHDRSSFTQGLVIDGELLYESCGQYGRSKVKVLDLHTGQLLQHKKLSRRYFGEGIAIVGEHLIQLTWKEQQAFVYHKKTLQPVATLSYQGEGWGLCRDGPYLMMSNGSEHLSIIDPKTFAIIKKLSLLAPEISIPLRINDIECVDSSIYANVWYQERIFRFDKGTGQLNGVIDASHLLSTQEKMAGGKEAVLNGIAYNPRSQTFFITGKYWPKLFEVKFVSLNNDREIANK